MHPCQGLLTAIVTPFHPDGRINEEAAVELGAHLLRAGSDGLVVCATTGESSTLSTDEQVGLFELFVEQFATEAIVVGSTGSNNTRHACELTERAVEAGVHGVLSVTPYYNKPNRRGLRRHYEEIALAAGGVPVILYNNPARTALNMAPDVLAELAQLDGIEAVKQSNAEELQLIDGLAVLAGNDDLLAKTLTMGGQGGICVASHIVGPEMKRLFKEPTLRAEIDQSLRDVYDAMLITTNPAPVKAALNMLGHIVGGLRLPLVEVDERERGEIRTVLERHALLSQSLAT